MSLLNRIDVAAFTPLGEMALPALTAGNGHGRGVDAPSSAPPRPSRLGPSGVASASRPTNTSRELKHRVKNRLIAELEPDMDLSKTAEVRQRIRTLAQGMEGDIITMQDVFVFEQESFEGGKVVGRLQPTGVRPKFMPKLEDADIRLSPSVFGLSDRFF